MKHALVVFVVGLLVCSICAGQAPLAESFKNPPMDSRILPIKHNMPEKPEAQDALLAKLRDQGFGGIVTNTPFEQYLENETGWNIFMSSVAKAHAQGMAMWLYDERGYPSGIAGDIVLRDHPEFEARGLMIAEASGAGALELDMPPGTLLRAAAFPVADGQIDLDGAVDVSSGIDNGKLRWTAPEGQWHVMAITESRLYDGTHAAISLAYKFPYVNLMMGEATDRFIEVTHEAYAARLGNDLAKCFTATFTDEPSLMSMWFVKQPYRCLPWSPGFAAEFQSRRGYELAPLIPALAAEAGPRTRKARYDFWMTVGELVSENYFGRIQTWCREHNTLSGGHLLCEEALLTHVPLYGDFFRCIRRLDAPSMDCLTSLPEEVPWFVGRMLSSAAELEGRTVTMSESSDHSQRYRPEGDTRPVREVTKEEIIGSFNRLIMNGITTFTSYYSWKGFSDEQLREINETVGRACLMMRGGRQVADVAFVYPAESMWTHFQPQLKGLDNAPENLSRIQHTYFSTLNALWGASRDINYIDSRTLAEATVEGGKMRYRDLEWKALVLPRVDTLPAKAWENIGAFWRTGGLVVMVDARPQNSESEFPAPAVQALAAEMLGDTQSGAAQKNSEGGVAAFFVSEAAHNMGALLDERLPRHLNIEPQGAIHYTHRRIDGRDVFFVINDSAEEWNGTIALPGGISGEIWDVTTGAIAPLSGPVGLKGYQAVVLRS